ncbi:MAG: hypothetical protein ACJ8HI_21305 [Massilia sp.]
MQLHEFYSRENFALKSRHCSLATTLAHNLIHIKCAESWLVEKLNKIGLYGDFSARPSQNLSGLRQMIGKSDYSVEKSRSALFLRNGNFLIRIKGMGECPTACAHSYPQKLW